MKKLVSKLKRGFPYLTKEIKSYISEKTPLFISVPNKIYLWWGGPCNAQCIFCPFKEIYEGKRKDNIRMTPDEKVPKIIHEAKELSGKGLLISFSGGEPLLWKPLFEIAELCNNLGIDFSFTTNGYLFNEKTIHKLIQLNLFNIGISLEAIDPQINEFLRPMKNGTKKTIDAIEGILSEKKRQNSDIRINIKCTLTQTNFRSIVDIVKRWGKTRGVLITPQPFESFEEVPDDICKKLTIQDIEGFKATINHLMVLKKQGYAINADEEQMLDFIVKYEHNNRLANSPDNNSRSVGCTIGNTTMFILRSGDVKLCPTMDAIGNINNDRTLKEIWFSERARKMRRKIKMCKTVCTISCTRKSSLFNSIVFFLRQ